MKRQRRARLDSGGITFSLIRACPASRHANDQLLNEYFLAGSNSLRSNWNNFGLQTQSAANLWCKIPNPFYRAKYFFRAAKWHALGFELGRQYEMQIALEDFDKHRSTDTTALRREVESLRRQFKENPAQARPLAWDTELLVRKTRDLDPSNIVSCSDRDWQQTLEQMHIGSEGIRVNDIRTVAHIEFVAAFAARNQLSMTYGNHCFHLEPRQTSID